MQPPPTIVVNTGPIVINPPVVNEPVPAPPSSSGQPTQTASNNPPRTRPTVLINNEPRDRRRPDQHPVVRPGTTPPNATTADAGKKTNSAATAPSGNAPQVTLMITPEQIQRERNEAVQFLNTARTDLRALQGRRLTAEQANTMGQADEYVRQAQQALDQGDVDKARNLANKAVVLANALVGTP